mgnify:CR=1 FL=1
MTRWTVPMLTLALVGCADFVDEDGNTSFRQVAEGLQSLGDRVAEMGEALERDASVEAVPWAELRQVLPSEIDGSPLRVDGDDARDRFGAGISLAAGKYAVDGDSMFVGVADLGALRSGAQLALRWVAPVFARRDFDGDVEEITVDGYPAIRIRGEVNVEGEGRRWRARRERDGGVLIALLVEDRFAVVAGAGDPRHEDLVYDALDEVDYRQLRRWEDFGSR